MWFLMGSSPRFSSYGQMDAVLNSRVRSHGPLSHDTHFSVMVAHASGIFSVPAIAKGHMMVLELSSNDISTKLSWISMALSSRMQGK
jgi:hypothetical protein